MSEFLRRVPPNCSFEVDDYESEWDFSRPFDFIHGRYLSGAVRDVPLLFQRIMNNLKPGGWVEMVDMSGDRILSDDDTVERATNLQEWIRLLNEACNKFGKPIDVARYHKYWMIDAGFKNVEEEIYKVGLLSYSRPVRMFNSGSLSVCRIGSP